MAKLPSVDPFKPQFPGDRATAPMALEESGETAWERFEALQKAHDMPFAPTEPGYTPTSARGFASTQPFDRSAKLAAPAAAPVRQTLTLDQVMVLARRNNRACPMPQAWVQLAALLPPQEGKSGPMAPPAPIDGAAWDAVSPMQKRLRLRDQIEWAERTGALESVHGFLAGLSDDQWLYM